MSRTWTHAAMLLLGISLAVGFYEGRRLVRNTSKALTAMGQIGTAADRRDRRDEPVARAVDPSKGRARAEPKGGGTRKGHTNGRKGSKASLSAEDAAQIKAMRQRQRVRGLEINRTPGLGTPGLGSRAIVPGATLPLGQLAIPDDGPDEELLDTGLELEDLEE